MIEFFSGGIYTFVVISFGFIAGYLFATRKVDEIIKDIKVSLKREIKPNESGPVKVITPKEREMEKTKPFRDRVRELVGDETYG